MRLKAVVVVAVLFALLLPSFALTSSALVSGTYDTVVYLTYYYRTADGVFLEGVSTPISVKGTYASYQYTGTLSFGINKVYVAGDKVYRATSVALENGYDQIFMPIVSENVPGIVATVTESDSQLSASAQYSSAYEGHGNWSAWILSLVLQANPGGYIPSSLPGSGDVGASNVVRVIVDIDAESSAVLSSLGVLHEDMDAVKQEIAKGNKTLDEILDGITASQEDEQNIVDGGQKVDDAITGLDSTTADSKEQNDALQASKADSDAKEQKVLGALDEFSQSYNLDGAQQFVKDWDNQLSDEEHNYSSGFEWWGKVFGMFLDFPPIQFLFYTVIFISLLLLVVGGSLRYAHTIGADRRADRRAQAYADRRNGIRQEREKRVSTRSDRSSMMRHYFGKD